MRASRSNGNRYYRDSSRIEHRDACDQPTLRADDVEDQIVAFLHSLSCQIPDDWSEQIEDLVIPAEQRAETKQQEMQIEARLERATRLHLEGHITYDQFIEEKHRAQTALADLRPAAINAIMTVGEVLKEFDRHWREAKTPLQKNGLLRMSLARVRVQRFAVTAVQPSLAAHPLMRFFCRSGSDGI